MVQPELVKSLVKEDLWLLYEKGLLGQCKPKDFSYEVMLVKVSFFCSGMGRG
jgi:hypothetical protein